MAGPPAPAVGVSPFEAVGGHGVVVVLPGAERWPPAGEDDHLDVIVLLRLVQQRDEVVEIGEAQRVVLLRAVQHEAGDGPVPLVEHGVVHG